MFHFSKTIRRNMAAISAIFIAFILLLNGLLYYVITYQLTESLDLKINHEAEHILSAFSVSGDSLVIVRASEFAESDLVKLSDNYFLLQIFLPDQRLLLRSKNLSLTVPVNRRKYRPGEGVVFEDTRHPLGVLRTGYYPVYQHGVIAAIMQISYSKQSVNDTIQEILMYSILSLPLFLLLSLPVSYYLARRAFLPVQEITQTAKRISAVNLQERFPVSSDPHDELGQLTETLNDLFARLNTQVSQIRSVTNNASHQLLTPLTAINAELDFLLKTVPADSSYHQSLTDIRQQSDTLVAIIKSLLLIASAEAAPVQHHIFYLHKAVAEYILPYFAHPRFVYELPENVMLRGKAEYFGMILSNLLDNAVKYSPPASPVLITGRTDDEMLELSIADMGPGIRAEEQEKVFQRFYRGNDAVTEQTRGYGLGLSLVKALCTAMHADIVLTHNQPAGTIAKLRFRRIHD